MSYTNAETAAGLRAMADLLDKRPDLANGFKYGDRLLFGVSNEDDPKAALAEWARAAVGLPREKEYSGSYANLDIDFGGGVIVRVYAERAQVCERVVTGTREVTKTVKDPEALKAVPDVEVTVTEEVVEWICRPLLADEAAS